MGRQGIGKSKRRAGQPEYSSTQLNVQRTDVNLGHRAKAPSFQKPWSSTVDYRFRIEPSLLSNQPLRFLQRWGEKESCAYDFNLCRAKARRARSQVEARVSVPPVRKYLKDRHPEGSE